MKLSARRALLVTGVILCAVLVLKGSSLLVPTGNWSPEGTMTTARLGASAALLGDGRILITGGGAGTGAVTTVDFFNQDGTISAAPAMTNTRSGHISVTLKDGRILVAGGITAGGSTTSTVEIFDAITNSWTATGFGMVEARSGATAALLSDGRVLIAGGQNGSTISSTIEVFDPALGAFTSAGMMSSPRTQHAMTTIQDGRVLIVGGFNGSIPVSSTDIFDPVTGMVSAGPNLSVARFGHSATTMLNGQVVIIGGNNGNANPAQMDATPAEAVDFTAATPAFATLATNLAIPREGHLALLLPNNNNILIVGGTSTGTPIPSAELFMPQESAQGVWTYGFAATGGLTSARSGVAGSANQLNVPSSTMQRSGVVMVAGGNDASGNALNTTEAYGYPTVRTDQSDYPPGTTVTITGSGFQPNETITIQLVESPLFDTHGPYTVQADANGNFVDTSFITDSHDLNIRFYLTATGGTSGFQAQNTFTDANDTTTTIASCTSTTVDVGGASTTCTATVKDIGGSNGSPTGSVAWSIAPNDGTFSPVSCNLATGGSSTSTCSTTFTGTSGGSTTITAAYAGGGSGNTQWKSSIGTLAMTVDQAPAITSTNNTTLKAGTAGSFTVTATGFPAPTFTESGTLPSGVTLTSSGVLSGTPAGGTGGTYSITITASNGILPNATQNFILTVNQAPAITSTNSTTFAVGTAGAFTVTSTGFPAPTLSESGTLPSGVTFNAGTGLLSGTPATNTGGTYSITFTASNGVTPNATQNFTLTVNQAPVITSANNTIFTVGSTGSFTLTASGFPTPTFTESGALPSGVTLNAAGVLSGTPAAGTGGIYPIIVTASNGILPNATQNFTLTVNQAAVITSANSATFIVGSFGSFRVTATGFPAPTFSEIGALPGGVTFSSTGVLSGTATATGNFPITITASNGVSPSATQNFTLTIGQAPAITSANSTSFTVNSPSAFTVTATGFPAPTLSETGALPSGVTLSSAGVLSGTPALGTVGSYPIAITAHNGVSSDATQNFMLTVIKGTPAFNSLAVTPSSISYGTASVTVSGKVNLPAMTAESVTITLNGVQLTAPFSGNPNNFSATFDTHALPVSGSPYTITISYPGDANFNSVTDVSLTLTVTKVTPTVNWSSPAAITYNTALSGTQLNATFTAFNGGTVAVVGTPTYTPASGAVLNAGAGQTLSVSFAPTDTTDYNTASGAVLITVNKASTSTAVLSSLNPSFSGQSVTFTATVSNSSGTSATPTGSVQFMDGASALGLPQALNSAGKATLATSSLSVATHLITAVYANTDGNFTGSASAGLSQVVKSAETTTAASNATATFSPLNQVVALAATVTSAGGTVNEGMVSFTVKNGAVVIGTSVSGNVSSGLASANYTLPGGTTVGAYTIDAEYTDVGGNFTASGDTAHTLTVTGTPPSITSAASTTFMAGTPGSFTVTTSGTPTSSLNVGGATLPGSVMFHDNANGTATLEGTATAAGSYQFTITAQNGVTPNATQLFTLTVAAGPITHLALTPATATITAGASQTYAALGLDMYNNPAGDVTSATIFTIAPDGSCGTPNPGNNTCTATVADVNGSSHTVTGTYMNSATGSASLTVNAASPTQLVITSNALAIVAGQCSGNITVTSQDQYGNASNTSNATQVNLSSASGTGKFYSDSTCQTQIPVSNGKISVSIAANSSSQTFAYEDTTQSPLPNSTTMITAADDAAVLTSGTQEETILQLVFTTSSFTVTQNTCSAQITLTAKNAKGAATNVTVAATLGLTSTSNGATFYSDNACAMAITPTGTPLASDVTLGSGTSAVSFSYEDGAAGNPTITATIGGYSVAQQEQIGTPPSVTSNPSGQAVTYGSNAMFTAAASGTPTPTVQWQVSSDGTNWNNVGDGGVYSGATTTTLTLTVPPVSLSGTQYRAVFTNAVGSANSNAASLTVNPEALTVSIIGNPTKTYDATTAATLTSANFSIAGLVGTDKFTVTQTMGMYASANAGSGITVTATLSASNFTPYGSTVANNYSFPTSASGTGTINRANATITVTPYNVTYDGNPHAATGTAKGVNGEDLSGELDLTHTTHTSAGNYSSDYWTFTDTTGNYNNVTATTITDCIKKANVTVMFSNTGPFTYTGSAQAPTYAVNGVNSEVLTSSATVSYSGTQFNNAAYSSASAPASGGNYTQSVAFGGSTNYNALSQPATQLFTINRATAMIAVAPYNVTYDGNSHTATGTAKGVNGEDLSNELDLTHTAHTDAGTYSSDYWTFIDGAGNYTNVAATTITDGIAKASSTTSVTFENGPYVYRGTAFTASAQVVGAGGLASSVAVAYSGDCTNVTVANGCTATATYGGDPDHYGSNDTKSITIVQAPSTTFVNCPASVTYNGLAQSPCTATATGASLSVVLPISYSNNLNAGNATATATYGGDQNHTSSSSAVNFTINPATTSLSVVSSLNPSNWGNVVTLTATVANTSTTVVPTGSVSFYNTTSGANCSSLGASMLLDTVQLSTIGANQQASTSTPNLPVGPGNTVGTDAILACYNYNPADPNFNVDFVTSNGTMIQTVNPAPIATLVPSSLSFGGQQGGTTSGAQTVTICNGPSGVSGSPCFNASVSTAALMITNIGFTSSNTNPVYFNQTSTCPIGAAGLAVGASCASNVKFAPPLNAQGIATALLTVTDNNENVASSTQSASLVGAGTSAVMGVGSLSTYAIFGTANGCSIVNVSGNGSVDSFGGPNNTSGNVGTNGNVTLSGYPVVNGAVYSPVSGTGNCGAKTMTALSISGKAQATGGLQALSGSVNYPLPQTPNPAPSITTQNISGSCGSISGCSSNGSKDVTLVPGQYGNVNISGGTTINVSGGSYNINSLTLSGNSTLVVTPNTGAVVLNLAGKSLSGGNAVLDFSGGSMSNPSGVASNLQLYYAGSQPMKLSGGTGSYAVVYAPNAPVNVSGGSHFYGSIIGSTVNSSGNTAIHYPTSLPSISSGNSIWFSSTGLTVKGLPNTGSVKLYVTNASINFMANGTTYNLPVPNAVITFSSTATSASTTWDTTNNRWSTLIPMSSVNGNATIHTFFDGVAFQVPPSGFPTGIQNVTWQAAYSTSTTGVSFNWQWGAAVYGTLPVAGATGNYSSFGVNSLDSSVPAGTPVNYEGNLVFGDTGAGYTGLYANFVGVVPTIAPMNIAPSSYDFGLVPMGSPTTASVPFVLTNNDSVPYTISSIQMTGIYASDFVQTNNCPINPNTLGAGASCTFTVNLTPSASSGTKETAKIVINDNANNSPQTVFLKGTVQ